VKKTYEIELRRTSFITVSVEAETIEEAEALAWDEVNDRPDTNYASWDVESIEEVTNQGESE
jgi:hypothetical protein